MKHKYSIKQIKAEETYIVRHPILRAGKPISSCVFSGDDLDSTVHLGLYFNDALIGVASFMKNENKLFDKTPQYQLRGMAILKDYQSLGLGRIILSHAENLLQSKNVKLIWCNAREIALNFYKRNGYSTVGKPFEIPEIGTHYIMYKNL